MIQRVQAWCNGGEGLWLLIVVMLGMAMRAAAIAGYGHEPQSDELAYQSMALGLNHGGAIVDNMGNYAMYNVGYPLFVLSPVYALLGEQLVYARLANLALGGLSIVLCHALARQAGAGRMGRLAAAAGWALYLPSSVYGVYLAKENLMIPLMLGVLWCALRLARTPGWRLSLACGLLLGLLALTGNAGLSLVGVVGLALLLSPGAWSSRFACGLAVMLVAVLVTSPWLARNARVIGAPVLNTNGGFNLYTGNNPAATGWFISIADTPRGATWNSLRQAGEVQASEVLRQEAMAWMQDHPTDFAVLAFKKAAYFWMPPLHAGKGPGSSTETLFRALWTLQYLLLWAMAVASLGVPALRNKGVTLLWLALASYTAVHMVFYVSFRYREPIMPVLVVLAALVLELALATRKRRLPPASAMATARGTPGRSQ